MSKKRTKAKEGNYRWLITPKPTATDDEILEELSGVLAAIRAKHGVSVVKLLAMLKLVEHHLAEYLLNEGLDSEQ